MKYLFLFIVLNGFVGVSQENTFFNIARNGTIEDAKKWVVQSPEVVNKPNEHGFSPLILACYSGNEAMVAFLVNNNADLNYVSQEGTALMGATVKGNTKIVAFLLKNGANLNLTNQAGISSLMYAVQFKNIEIIKLLLNYNADKFLVDSKGRTAFEYAIFTKQDDIINLLK